MNRTPYIALHTLYSRVITLAFWYLTMQADEEFAEFLLYPQTVEEIERDVSPIIFSGGLGASTYKILRKKKTRREKKKESSKIIRKAGNKGLKTNMFLKGNPRLH